MLWYKDTEKSPYFSYSLAQLKKNMTYPVFLIGISIGIFAMTACKTSDTVFVMATTGVANLEHYAFTMLGFALGTWFSRFEFVMGTLVGILGMLSSQPLQLVIGLMLGMAASFF